MAVSLLWSIANDSHERAIEEVIKARHPDLFVSLSSEVAPYLGEYERTITTIFNAYIGPTISSYLSAPGRVPGGQGTAQCAAHHAGLRRGAGQ